MTHWRTELSSNKTKFELFPSAPCRRWCSVQDSPEKCLNHECDDHLKTDPVEMAKWILTIEDNTQISSVAVKHALKGLMKLKE